ncbi:MAG: LysM peptidoglycan-binding domain-containing protein, partial [Duncaniella sp.]|nr:LysM peptidoglycan-binding domain-containing protein [Duncaniella sp.]
KKYGTTVTALKNANGMKTDKLQIGQTLKIPAKSTGTSSSKKSTTTTKKRRR